MTDAQQTSLESIAVIALHNSAANVIGALLSRRHSIEPTLRQEADYFFLSGSDYSAAVAKDTVLIDGGVDALSILYDRALVRPAYLNWLTEPLPSWIPAAMGKSSEYPLVSAVIRDPSSEEFVGFKMGDDSVRPHLVDLVSPCYNVPELRLLSAGFRTEGVGGVGILYINTLGCDIRYDQKVILDVNLLSSAPRYLLSGGKSVPAFPTQPLTDFMNAVMHFSRLVWQYGIGIRPLTLDVVKNVGMCEQIEHVATKWS